MERKILSVFVASPGDLRQEREILKREVERVNKILGKRIGWQIEVLGWEDTLPGFARPQALINKDVTICDLFIGMLWKRWGTDTDKYSSGFEEEFSIAHERRSTSDRPEIWLYFKQVDEELCKDPGEQLQKALAFREEQKQKKELLYKEFPDETAFSMLIHDALSAFLLELHNKEKQSAGASGAESSYAMSSQSKRVEEPELICNKQNAQLIQVFTKLSKCLGEGKESEIEYWERVRAHLSTSALFSQSHVGELFGVHEINLVYKKKKRMGAGLERSFVSHAYLFRPLSGIRARMVLAFQNRNTSDRRNSLFIGSK